MNHENKFYVTTPIYYVTAKPHLGSLYSTLLADVAKRWNMLLGKETMFVTGTDEHGQKVAEAAQRAGKDPKEFVDSFIHPYKQMWHAYGINYDRFIRTTDTYHVKAVQEWITILLQKGDVYKSFYEGWYCTPCETYVTEKDAVEAGDAKKSDIPLCASCGRETSHVSEESYFFKLSAYQDKLLKFYEENPNFVVPKERLNEVINFVKSGLKDLSISRTTITWGVPFPGDKRHVTYVWADALNNYITAIGWGQPGKESEFNCWWPADLHIMGKDIVRFHAVYWPAFLMALDLPLPKRLLVHGWITVNQQKMSKSFGNVVDPELLLSTYGSDQVRYYLMRQMAINQDGDFSTQDLEQRITSELANDLGNLLNRMTTLALKYDMAQIKAPQAWNAAGLELRDQSYTMLQEFKEYMDDCHYHMALARVWKYINLVNAYFHANEPWKLVKQDKAAFEQVLSATAHSLRVVAITLWPVMPQKMEQLLASLGITNKHEYNFDMLEVEPWHKTFTVHHVEPLFMKIEPKVVEEVAQEAVQEKPALPTITFDEFAKVIVAVGTIEDVQEVPKSSKLLQLRVNCGEFGVRQILSGVREHYTPAELIGKQGVFVLNLEPRKIMGLESQGMMLFAKDEQGKLKMATVSGPVPHGMRLQ